MTKKQKKMLFRIIISAIIFILSIIIPNKIAKILLYLISYLISGYDIILKAIRNILRLQIFDENFLMLIASVGAFLIGEFPEAVAIALFYQIGELFQSYAVGKSRKSIKELMNLKPEYANLLKDGEIKKVSPEDVKKDDIIIVNAGEKIPLDGIVTEGNATLDTSKMTGESIPFFAKIGNKVTSGSISLNGMLKIRVENTFSESAVSKVLKLITEATDKKSKSENFITKFSRYYTPVVVISALVLGIIIPLLFPVEASEWIKKAIVFLVVSCPCALIISVPLTFFGGIGTASKNGILIKGSQYIELLSKAKTVIFDKTGTITKGNYKITEVFSKTTKDELLKIAVLTESFSNHPAAVALKNEYQFEATDKIKDFCEISGMGVSAEINGKISLVGNEKLLKSHNIEFEPANKKGTVIYVSYDGIYLGYIIISDEIKPNAKEAISILKKNKIRRTLMLTGDKKEIAQDVCEAVGIDELYSELLPHEKTQYINEIKNESEVIYAGDGINDAPSLIYADVGIAMGAIGSDAAIEASDVVIIDDNPKKIATAVLLSKKTMKIAYQNIIISISVKFLFLILGAFGICGLWGAVFADVGITIIAILNALRTMNFKE